MGLHSIQTLYEECQMASVRTVELLCPRAFPLSKVGASLASMVNEVATVKWLRSFLKCSCHTVSANLNVRVDVVYVPSMSIDYIVNQLSMTVSASGSLAG